MPSIVCREKGVKSVKEDFLFLRAERLDNDLIRKKRNHLLLSARHIGKGDELMASRRRQAPSQK